MKIGQFHQAGQNGGYRDQDRAFLLFNSSKQLPRIEMRPQPDGQTQIDGRVENTRLPKNVEKR
jgi:hypothetical protein